MNHCIEDINFDFYLYIIFYLIEKKYMNSFWVKYTFRFLHISTVVALGGKIIYDYIFPCGTNEISKP